MHSIALAILPVAAIGAEILFHPFPIAVRLVLIVPDFDEIVLVNVALGVICADAGAGGD